MNNPSLQHPIEHGTDVDEDEPREDDLVGTSAHVSAEDLRNEEPTHEANTLRRQPAEPA